MDEINLSEKLKQLEAEVERQKKINELLKKVDALERKLL